LELLCQGVAPDHRYLRLATKDCLKSRMREKRTSDSVRGGRQSLHCRNIMKGVSRLSTRLVKMIKILYQLSDKCKKKNIWIGSLIYKLSKLFLNILYPIVAFFNTGYGLNDK